VWEDLFKWLVVRSETLAEPEEMGDQRGAFVYPGG
jgi:hypothetical protein